MVISRRRRRSHLKERFGPEYDHAVTTAGQRDGERRLTEIEGQHDDLAIRELPSITRERFLEEWRQAESRFVSDPPDAVRAADRIVLRVLEERGYPTDGDLDHRTAHVAADFPDAVSRATATPTRWWSEAGSRHGEPPARRWSTCGSCSKSCSLASA